MCGRGIMDFELLLKFIGYFSDYLAALSRALFTCFLDNLCLNICIHLPDLKHRPPWTFHNVERKLNFLEYSLQSFCTAYIKFPRFWTNFCFPLVSLGWSWWWRKWSETTQTLQLTYRLLLYGRMSTSVSTITACMRTSAIWQLSSANGRVVMYQCTV